MQQKRTVKDSFMARQVISLLLAALIPTVLVGYFSFQTAKTGLEKLLRTNWSLEKLARRSLIESFAERLFELSKGRLASFP